MLPSKREERLDQEWVSLIKSALEQGMTPEEIRYFLHESKRK
ncbi:anti-repressor SinI family protein [Salipaludibacillus daqingensis]|nr:anti-repressor SinI family protein [Salipaludibacillus daqingensis]